MVHQVSPLHIMTIREAMKNLLDKLFVSSTTLLLLAGNALASPCGPDGPKPCHAEVPEPGTAYLFLAAGAVAVAVAKFRKK